MTFLDFNSLPDRGQVEAIVNEMDSETLLAHINMLRQRQLNESEDISEDEIRAGILLVRRFRAMRETRAATKKKPAGKEKDPAPSLSDLMRDLS